MGGILKALGPVCIFRSLGQNWRSLRKVTMQEFLSAAQELQMADMGALVHIQHERKPQAVFIKKKPDEIREMLEMNEDLCDVDTYSSRFYHQPNKCISWSLRNELVAMGYVDKKSFM